MTTPITVTAKNAMARHHLGAGSRNRGLGSASLLCQVSPEFSRVSARRDSEPQGPATGMRVERGVWATNPGPANAAAWRAGMEPEGTWPKSGGPCGTVARAMAEATPGDPSAFHSDGGGGGGNVCPGAGAWRGVIVSPRARRAGGLWSGAAARCSVADCTGAWRGVTDCAGPWRGVTDCAGPWRGVTDWAGARRGVTDCAGA